MPKKTDLVTSTPQKYNLDFIDVNLPTVNNKHLFGWYIQNKSQNKAPSIVFMHGWGGSVSSLLPFAPLFHSLGFNILILDGSNHGASDYHGPSSMKQFAVDIEYAMNWLAKQENVLNKELYVLGHSNASAAAILLATKLDIKGIICLSSFLNTKNLLNAWMVNKSKLSNYISRLIVIQLMQLYTRCHYDSIAPFNTILDVRCPILFVHGDNDYLTKTSDISLLVKKSSHELSDLINVPSAGHDSILKFKNKASDRIARFIQSTIKQ